MELLSLPTELLATITDWLELSTLVQWALTHTTLATLCTELVRLRARQRATKMHTVHHSLAKRQYYTLLDSVCGRWLKWRVVYDNVYSNLCSTRRHAKSYLLKRYRRYCRGERHGLEYKYSLYIIGSDRVPRVRSVLCWDHGVLQWRRRYSSFEPKFKLTEERLYKDESVYKLLYDGRGSVYELSVRKGGLPTFTRSYGNDRKMTKQRVIDEYLQYT